MKAYIINIILVDSNPLIWRKVIVPAEITFKRLHDVIQLSMGWGNYHLYDFNINEEKLRITSDEEAINEYEFYSKKKLTEKNDPHGFIARMLEIKPILSNKIKIDQYLPIVKKIEYVYDFGDYWKHDIEMQEIVEDYECGYATCIEGKGACPPEDVGGICGYEDFLKIINNKDDIEYESMNQWANAQNYKQEFDIQNINELLKLKRN